MAAEIKKKSISHQIFPIFPANNWKTIFLKEFFIEIWLKIEGHQYIYNAEIKYEKSYCVAV